MSAVGGATYTYKYKPETISDCLLCFHGKNLETIWINFGIEIYVFLKATFCLHKRGRSRWQNLIFYMYMHVSIYIQYNLVILYQVIK